MALILWIILATATIILLCRFLYDYSSGRCTSKARMTGKTVIITGASAGIGKETALDLASRGARVIMACRNRQKAQEVADNIIHTTGNKQVLVRDLELSSMSSVRRFAKEILETESSLHVLINNAGMAGRVSRCLTADGLEETMATNHFGHFLLTNLLLGLLKASTPSRIINVSSRAHATTSSFDASDLNYDRRPYPSKVGPYSNTKLANILFNNELARKLQGTGVTANCLHPGVVNTEILDKSDKKIFTFLIKLCFLLVGKDEKLGAQTTIHLAVSEDLEEVSGEYFADCKIAERSQTSKDMGISKKVWENSEELVKLKPEEKHF